MGYGPPPQGYPPQGGYGPPPGYPPQGYPPQGYGYGPPPQAYGPRPPNPTDQIVYWLIGLGSVFAVGFIVGFVAPVFGFLIGGIAFVCVGLGAYGGLVDGAPPVLKGFAERVRPFWGKAAVGAACLAISAPLAGYLALAKEHDQIALAEAQRTQHEAECTQARADASAAATPMGKRSAAGVLQGCGEAEWAASLTSDADRQAKDEETRARETKAKADWPGALKGVDATIAASDKLVATGKVLDADDLLSSKQSGLGAFAGTTVTTDVDFVDAQARLEAKRKAIAPRVAPLRKAKADAEERERKKQEAADQKAAALADTRGPMPQVSAWDGSVIAVERYLKPRMKDPDSLDMANCTMPVVDGAYWKTACAYRARNSFNALVLEGGVFYIQAGGLAGEGQVVKVEALQ